MDKKTKYLTFRLELLNDEMDLINEKKKKSGYEINEIENKIKEISKSVDSAYEIFSPRPVSGGFVNEELSSLKNRSEKLKEIIEEYEEKLNLIESEMITVREALDEGFDDTADEHNNTASDNYNKNESDDTLYGVKILEKQEMERQRIARELHDSTVQVLTNLIHKCEICSKVMDKDPIRAKLELEVMSKSLRDTIDEMREIIFNLRPMSFDDLGIEVTLNRIIDNLKKNSDMNINLKITGESVDLPSAVSLTFIRIIQEAVNNAIKHSYAKNIFIFLKYEDDYVYICIEDDGIGFDYKKKRRENKGFGLSMMEERIYLLAGNINIQSDKEKGTKIEICIPIER